MKRLYFFIVLLLIPLTYANLEFDFQTPMGVDLSNHIMTLKFGNEFQKISLGSNLYELTLPDGTYHFEVIIDNPSTPTPDYFGKKDIILKSMAKETFLILPIGYVQGTIQDLKGNLVSKAELQFSCYMTKDVIFPTQTDKTGFFIIPNMPEGKCIVIANDGKIVGRSEFEVKRGNPTEIKVILNEPLEKKPLIWLYILVIVIIFLILFNLKKRKGASPKLREIPEDTNNNGNYNNNTETILKTLFEKEKEVVLYLLENNYHSSQSKIRHAIKIPRTSLSRVIQKLERKNLISIEKHGKLVTIKLTDFFLGK